MGEVEEIPLLSHSFLAYSTQWVPKLHWDTISPWPRMRGSLESLEISLHLEVNQNGVVLLFLNIPGLDAFIQFKLLPRMLPVGTCGKHNNAQCFYPCSRVDWHRARSLTLVMPSPAQTPKPGLITALGINKAKHMSPTPPSNCTTPTVPGMWFADLWWLSRQEMVYHSDLGS